MIVRADPGSAPEPQATSVDVIAWAHDETLKGLAVQVTRPAAPAMRWSSSTPHPAPADCRSTSPRPTPTTSRRRRTSLATAACGWRSEPGGAEPDQGHRRVEPLGARLPVAADRGGQQPQEPDLQHPGDRDAGAAGRAARLAVGQRRLDWAVKRTADSSGRLYTWAHDRPYTTPFVADPKLRSQVVGTVDFNDDVDAAAVAKVLRANGIVDAEPYRKLGRNQLRVAMFPAVEPDDVSALTDCIDWVVERL